MGNSQKKLMGKHLNQKPLICFQTYRYDSQDYQKRIQSHQFYIQSIRQLKWKYNSKQFIQTRLQVFNPSINEENTIDYTNQRITILTKIIQVDFQKLYCLNLNGNLIDNIESLSFLKAPLLEQIFLEKNLITRMNSFDKMYFQKLVKISIENNPISDIKLFRMLVSEEIRSIQIQTVYKYSGKIFSQIKDISIFAKLNAPCLKNLNVYCKNSIGQFYVIKLISQARITSFYLQRARQKQDEQLKRYYHQKCTKSLS